MRGVRSFTSVVFDCETRLAGRKLLDAPIHTPRSVPVSELDQALCLKTHKGASVDRYDPSVQLGDGLPWSGDVLSKKRELMAEVQPRLLGQ